MAYPSWTIVSFLPALLSAAWTDTELAEAEAVAEALALVQNQWAMRSVLQGRSPCDVPSVPSLVARSRILGGNLHERLLALPPPQGPTEPDLLARRSLLDERYLAAVAYQEAVIERQSRGCQASHRPAPGIETPSTPTRVALIAGEGHLCPDGVPTHDSVVVTDHPVCLQPSTITACGCTPMPVHAGAFLHVGSNP